MNGITDLTPKFIYPPTYSSSQSKNISPPGVEHWTKSQEPKDKWDKVPGLKEYIV